MTKVIKRNKKRTEFDKAKIYNAIMKAMKFGSGKVDKQVAFDISNTIEELFKNVEEVDISNIELKVFEYLCELNHKDTARAYWGYKSLRDYKRVENTTDYGIMSLVAGNNKDIKEENSNKNSTLASTQRDYIAGEVSKDIARRKKLPPYIVQAHDDGVLHYHDMDYAIQPIFNCCLIDIKDMLDNGTVINGKMIETPNSFQVACTVMTQIIAQVASNQYGGQSISIKHLAKYLKKSEQRYCDMLGLDKDHENITKLVQKELESGVQTIQYQVNTLMTTNG